LKDWNGNWLEIAMENRWILLFIAASAEYRLVSDITPELHYSVFRYCLTKRSGNLKFKQNGGGGCGGGGGGGGDSNTDIQPLRLG
jgi:hypothetical protein